jgi:general secretion pathway protein G
MQNTIARLRRRQSILRDREGGFTLIELLIVIVILGILAAIVVFAVQNLTGSSAKSACGADYKTVETAQEAYKAQQGTYATTSTQLTTQASNGNGPWLKEFPTSPHYTIGFDNAATIPDPNNPPNGTLPNPNLGSITTAATTSGHTTAVDGSGNCQYVS